MKKNLYSLFMAVGLGIIVNGIQTANACKNDPFPSTHCAHVKPCRFGLMDLKTLEDSCKLDNDQMVNFVALGGTLQGKSLKHFSHFTQPGEGLVLGCTKKGSSNSSTIFVNLTTDQNPFYNQTSADSKYPLWKARVSLPKGSYTGKLYVTEHFEQTLASSYMEILTQKFKVRDNNELVILSK